MPVGKSGTGYWSQTGWVEGGTSSNDKDYDTLTKRGEIYGVQNTPDTPTQKESSISDLYNFKPTDIDTALSSGLKSTNNPYGRTVNEDQIRRNTMREFQAEIDAVNQLYSQKMSDVKQEGVGRLGETRAIGARAGLLGSDFGQAQREKTLGFNRGIEDTVRAEQAAKVAAIMGMARQSAADEIAAEREALKGDRESYLNFLEQQATRRSGNIKNLAARLAADGIDISTMDPAELQAIAQSYGASPDELFAEVQSYNQSQLESARENKPFEAGGYIYQFDPKTGQYVNKGTQYYKPTGGSGTGSGGTGTVSPAAQNILDLLNTNGGTVDDYVKGSSNAAQALRNEVYGALAGQGGVTQKSTSLYEDAQSIINEMIDREDWKKFGYSSKLGGQFTTGFGDMKMRADQINAVLARDNLGLLKGAMSDKDLAFIQAMSGGFSDGTISEGYAKERMQSIQKKIQEKVNQYQPAGGQESSKILVDPNGQTFDASDLTPEEYQEALNSGYSAQ